MSASTNSAEKQATPANTQVVPGRRWLLAILFDVVAIVILRWQHENLRAIMFDEAVLNLVSTGFAVLAVGTLIVWFLWRSALLLRYRRYAIWVVLMVLVGLAFSVRVEGVSGNMVMKFKWTWSKPKDATLANTGWKAADAADLSKVSDTDVTGFLGNDRTNFMAGPKLAKDWSASPPKVKWRREIGAGWSAFVSVNGFAVTMEQRGAEELVTCYQIQTGDPVWKYSIKARHENALGGIGPRSTPTIFNGKVYTLGATGHLACLDGATGKPIWTHDLHQELGLTQSDAEKMVYWGRAASCLILNGNVIVPLGGTGEDIASLVAYDAETGKEQWRGGKEQVSYASPIYVTLDGVPQIVIVNEASVTGHNPTNGKVLWRHVWPGNSAANASSSIPHVVGANQLLLSKGYGQGSEVIELSHANDEWQVKSVAANKKALMTKFTNLTIINGNVYGLSDGILECVSLPDLKRRWKSSGGRFGHGQVLGVGDVILVQTEQLEEIVLVAADPSKLEVLGRMPGPTGKSWNNLCLVNNLLLARSEEEAVCYELPLAP